MNKKIIPVLVVIGLIFAVGAAGVATFLVQRFTPTKERMDANLYFKVEKENQIPVIYNKVVLEEKGKVIDGKIYFTTDMVSKYLNPRFYVDKDTKELIYTLPTEIITIAPNQADYGYIIEGETGYISIELLEKYTKISEKKFDNPTRYVLEDDKESDVMVAVVNKESQVRVKGGIKSPILADIKQGQKVEVLEELIEWTKVATIDGFIGYVKSEDLENKENVKKMREITNEGYTNIQKGYKINLTWHQVTNPEGNKAIDSLLPTIKGVTTISPTWYSIKDNDGNITSLADVEYVNKVHAAGLEVWGLVDNFSKDIKTYEVLSHTTSRRNLIKQLVDVTLANQIDGINVDLEAIGEETAPHYVQFLRELSVSCRKEGIVLSVDNPVPMPYTKHYDREEQGVIADYVIIMGYDEHTNSSQQAGSVASLPFVEKGIEDTLKEVPKEKVINAIPFYTRLWITQPDGSFTSKVLGMNGADQYVQEQSMDKYWDEEKGQYAAVLENEEGFYQMWLEEEASLEEKMKLIPKYELAGVASWKLGLQRDTIWDVILKYMQE